MRKPLIAALIALMFVASCGAIRGSKLNPFNWFGQSREQPREEFGVSGKTEQRPLVDQVLSMEVEAYPGGAIVRATGLAPTQGYYAAELVAREVDDKGVLVYDFRLMPPPTRKPTGAQQTREVVVAADLTDRQLSTIRQIVVQGANNARSSRR